MYYLEHAHEGLRNFYHAKLRTLLALLGVLVGTASVVAMVLGGELATNEALKQFKSLGTDLLALTFSNAGENFSSQGKLESISLTQALTLTDAHPQIAEVAPYIQLFQPISYEGQTINGSILGVTHHFAEIAKIKLQAGRFISLLDKYQFYCVIGRDIYQALKKNSVREPLGQYLQMGKNIFVIVGIIDDWPENNFIYADVNHAILIPLLTATTMSQYAVINNILLRLKPNADIFSVETNLSQTIEKIYPGKRLDYRSAKELIAKMQKQSEILTVFLGLIGGISLIVGGIGVMNIMLVAVSERRREIGIRMAVGARRKDIGVLFLMEAVMLSLLGGILGVILGILIAYVIAQCWNWEFTLFFWPPITGFSVSVAVGIFFGFYPAYQATKLNPIDALRAD